MSGLQPSMSTSPDLFIYVVTSNHEPYIVEALQSISRQQTDYVFSVHVQVDGSVDDTFDKASRYCERYGWECCETRDSLKARGAMIRHRRELIKKSDSRYWCVLEGDDYWGDSSKIQKQINFMDSRPEFAISFHDVAALQMNDRGNHTFVPWASAQRGLRDFSVEELRTFQFAWLHLSSLFFRNLPLDEPVEYCIGGLGDMWLPALYADHGGAGYVRNIEPSVYRITGEGMWTGISERDKLSLKLTNYSRVLSYYSRIGRLSEAKFVIRTRILPYLISLAGGEKGDR